ncbi:hypothetical protein ACJX0J_019939, partial [Zea mays]
ISDIILSSYFATSIEITEEIDCFRANMIDRLLCLIFFGHVIQAQGTDMLLLNELESFTIYSHIAQFYLLLNFFLHVMFLTLNVFLMIIQFRIMITYYMFTLGSIVIDTQLLVSFSIMPQPFLFAHVKLMIEEMLI